MALQTLTPQEQSRRRAFTPDIQQLKDYDGSLSRASLSSKGSFPYGSSNRSEGSLPLSDDQPYQFVGEEVPLPLPSVTPPGSRRFGTPPHSEHGHGIRVRASISGDQFRPPIEHRFVKSSFSRSVECKVCSVPV